MIHQSYTCDAVPLRVISQLRFVAPERVLKAQMKGSGLNLLLLGNLLCIIFLFFFFIDQECIFGILYTNKCCSGWTPIYQLKQRVVTQ